MIEERERKLKRRKIARRVHIKKLKNHRRILRMRRRKIKKKGEERKVKIERDQDHQEGDQLAKRKGGNDVWIDITV